MLYWASLLLGVPYQASLKKLHLSLKWSTAMSVEPLCEQPCHIHVNHQPVGRAQDSLHRSVERHEGGSVVLHAVFVLFWILFLIRSLAWLTPLPTWSTCTDKVTFSHDYFLKQTTQKSWQTLNIFKDFLFSFLFKNHKQMRFYAWNEHWERQKFNKHFYDEWEQRYLFLMFQEKFTPLQEYGSPCSRSRSCCSCLTKMPEAKHRSHRSTGAKEVWAS